LAKYLASFSLALAVDFFCNIFAKQFHPPEIGGFYLLLILQYMNSINTTSYPILEKNGFQITSVDISSFSQYES